MKRMLMKMLLPVAVAVSGAACDGDYEECWTEEDGDGGTVTRCSSHSCQGHCYSYEEHVCTINGQPCEDWEGGWDAGITEHHRADAGVVNDEWGGYCDENHRCRPGEVCSPDHECKKIVANCPLTEECLADPEQETEEWEGTDPVYVGSATANGLWMDVEVDVDFYDDHLYGEGLVAGEGTNHGFIWERIMVTGTRNGNQLTGQMVSLHGGRSFDVTFTATLLSGSEIEGRFFLQDEFGKNEGTFKFFRTSQCGCETGEPTVECRRNADCLNGGVCVDGTCVECFRAEDCAANQVCMNGTCQDKPGCTTNSECASTEVCTAGQCVPGCQFACCEDAQCTDKQTCVEHECKTPCTHRCQCQAGESCENGYCTIPTEPPPRTCTTDCDCDYNAGERCVENVCTLP